MIALTRQFCNTLSLTEADASPDNLLQKIRHHWAAIENGLHWVRDVVLGEDWSQVHKATASQALAALRNLAISLARLAGFDSFSAAIDAFQADHHRALQLMALIVVFSFYVNKRIVV